MEKVKYSLSRVKCIVEKMLSLMLITLSQKRLSFIPTFFFRMPQSFLSKQVCKSNEICTSKYFGRYTLDDMECCGSNA